MAHRGQRAFVNAAISASNGRIQHVVREQESIHKRDGISTHASTSVRENSRGHVLNHVDPCDLDELHEALIHALDFRLSLGCRQGGGNLQHVASSVFIE
ncbi:hypothetical protein PsorP6_017643 [Peronosclerospora sorghi]|uniref:Uncharacterized protein n=1 Tax=Peronosclerospora sorghi TaxID=230839 RepID=A0ACC0WKX9_9STRA|nr:hypothetical protein PsorP6_017643 [Peronosclerospora sorghi]